MFRKVLTFHDLGIVPADVYRQMGYGPSASGGQQPEPQVVTLTADILSGAAAVARPQYCFQVSGGVVDADGGCLTLGDCTFHIGKTIGRQLLGSEAFALFVATAGSEYEQWRQQDDLVRTYVADALGSVMAEACADRMEEALQASIDKLGWQHTNRFSPGYCGWHVSEQQRLFPLFGVSAPCGVTLTDSSLMLPIKSVSGIIGLGRQVRRLDYACGLCDAKQCFRRRCEAAAWLR